MINISFNFEVGVCGITIAVILKLVVEMCLPCFLMSKQTFTEREKIST